MISRDKRFPVARYLLVLLITANGAILLPAPAVGESQKNIANLQETHIQTTPDSAALQQVFIDPQTGKRRQPTHDETLARPTDKLENQLRVPLPREDKMIVRPDGMMILKLGSRHMSFVRTHTHEDGTISTDCTMPHHGANDSEKRKAE